MTLEILLITFSLLLVGWECGVGLAAIALMVVLSTFLVGANAAMVTMVSFVLFSGVVMARIATALVAPLFLGQVPQSLKTFATLVGLLAVLESSFLYSALAVSLKVSSANFSIPFAGMIGAVIMSAAVVAAAVMVFVGLIELPLYWICAGKRVHVVAWISSLRPVLVCFFVGYSITQISVLFVDTVEKSLQQVVELPGSL